MNQAWGQPKYIGRPGENFSVSGDLRLGSGYAGLAASHS